MLNIYFPFAFSGFIRGIRKGKGFRFCTTFVQKTRAYTILQCSCKIISQVSCIPVFPNLVLAGLSQVGGHAGGLFQLSPDGLANSLNVKQVLFGNLRQSPLVAFEMLAVIMIYSLKYGKMEYNLAPGPL